MQMTGRCRCGEVTFEVAAPPLMTMACHCRGCQRMTGGAFSLGALVAPESFRLTGGEPAIGGLHGPSRHYFCPRCMSWLFTRPEGIDLVVVRTTMLDQRGWDTPFMENYTSEKLPWAVTPARHSYPEFPPAEAYPALIAEFAEQQAAAAPAA